MAINGVELNEDAVKALDINKFIEAVVEYVEASKQFAIAASLGWRPNPEHRLTTNLFNAGEVIDDYIKELYPGLLVDAFSPERRQATEDAFRKMQALYESQNELEDMLRVFGK